MQQQISNDSVTGKRKRTDSSTGTAAKARKLDHATSRRDNVAGDHENKWTPFAVGLKPTPRQQLILDEMIRVSKHCHNWCNYLVFVKDMTPDHLGKYVLKTGAKDVPADLRMPTEDDWYFENKMTAVKFTSLNYYLGLIRAVIRKSMLAAVELGDKLMTTQEGCFSLPKKCVRFLTAKDTTDAELLNWNVLITAESFSGKLRDAAQRSVRLGTPVCMLPPIDNGARITKRRNGEFVLNYRVHPKRTLGSGFRGTLAPRCD
jgi:hypothetical protein